MIERMDAHGPGAGANADVNAGLSADASNVQGNSGASGAAGSFVWLDAFDAELAGQFGQEKNSSVSDANGAPRIAVPLLTASDTLGIDLDSIERLNLANQEAQIRTLQSGLDQTRIKTQKQNEGQLKKMEEYAKKCRAAAHKSKLGKIFSMVGKVLGFAVAVGLATVAAVASGGAASPALALALVAMVGAGVALSSEISDRAGGATFSIASGFQTLGKKIGGDGKLAGGLLGLPFGMFDPSLFGMVAQGSAEAAHASEQSTMIAGIVGSVAGMLLVGLVSGRFLSSASKVGDAAQAAQQVSKEAFKSYWPKLFNQAGMAMQGVGNAVEAGINLDVARAQTAADKVEAARKEGEADLSRLSHDWEDIQESLGVAIKTLQDGLKQYGEFLRADAQNNMTVTANIGRATV